MPWKNSWFQLAACVALFSGVLLLTDLGGRKGPGLALPSFLVSLLSSTPVAGHDWTNSLGQVFKPVPGLNQIAFGRDEARVRDFAEFVHATGYNAVGGMISVGRNGTDGWSPLGDTWEKPGFPQTDDNPVVGISWTDAQAFCQWLTNKERQEKRLGPNQFYRLPTSAEWDVAVGNSRFPWGDQWPPPAGCGNLGGTEAKTPYTPLPGFDDGYARTCPVGNFGANAFGLHDMAGNVCQWCMDLSSDNSGQRILRGSAWYSSDVDRLVSAYIDHANPDLRNDAQGFRLVIVLAP